MRLWLRLAAQKEMREGTVGVRDESGRCSTLVGLCWEWSSNNGAAAPWTVGRRWHDDALAGRRGGLKVAAQRCARKAVAQTEGGGFVVFLL